MLPFKKCDGRTVTFQTKLEVIYINCCIPTDTVIQLNMTNIYLQECFADFIIICASGHISRLR